MKGNYYEVQITFNKQNYEALYNQLYLTGIENILEEDGIIKIYFGDDASDKINSLKSSLLEEKIIHVQDFHYEKLENKNWNAEWEISIEPVYIKNKIIIFPSWKKNELKNFENQILIEIDPKMSFGTGHNETTQLVLEMMSEHIKGDEYKLLDFGTGTGVLTIAGIKLGVASAVAIDTDDDAIENAEEYFRINSTSEKVKLIKSNIGELEETLFDIICANIIRSVIVDNFDHIDNKLKVNGKLFLSGILNSEEQVILDLLFQNDYEVKEILTKSEWIGIYAVKKIGAC
ncbi:MAG: 50S ribosomal protein L11 methyltransferase [Bacteroidota bacterium]|nr:50S ribosomal protein L11 methyltransferase [Bacteroidota bacterium]